MLSDLAKHVDDHGCTPFIAACETYHQCNGKFDDSGENDDDDDDDDDEDEDDDDDEDEEDDDEPKKAKTVSIKLIVILLEMIKILTEIQ